MNQFISSPHLVCQFGSGLLIFLIGRRRMGRRWALFVAFFIDTCYQLETVIGDFKLYRAIEIKPVRPILSQTSLFIPRF